MPTNNGTIPVLNYERALRLKDELVAHLQERGNTITAEMRAILAEVAELAEAATRTLPIDAVAVDEETGTVSFTAKPGEFGLFAASIAENAAALAALTSALEAANGQIALSASREEFETTAAATYLSAAVSMTAGEADVEGAVLTLPLTRGVGSPLRRGDGLAVRQSDGTARVVLVYADAPGGALSVDCFPQPFDAPDGAAVYLPAREMRADLINRFDLFEVDVSAFVGGGTPLVGTLSADVPAGTVAALPLNSCLFGVLTGESVRLTVAGESLSFKVSADLLVSDAPVSLKTEPKEVPLIPAGTEVRLTEQTLSSVLRRTAGGASSLITDPELDPENGARVIATLSADVDGPSVTSIPVTAVDREGDGTIPAPYILVVRDGDALTAVILSGNLEEDATEIVVDPVSLTAPAGAEVWEPSRASFNRVLESAGRYVRQVAAQSIDGTGLVSSTEFEQTTDAIRALAEAGDVRSILEITASQASLKGGRNLVLDAGQRIQIGSGTINTDSSYFNFTGGTKSVGITTQGTVLIQPGNDLILEADDGSILVRGGLNAGEGFKVNPPATFDRSVSVGDDLTVGDKLTVDGLDIRAAIDGLSSRISELEGSSGGGGGVSGNAPVATYSLPGGTSYTPGQTITINFGATDADSDLVEVRCRFAEEGGYVTRYGTGNGLSMSGTLTVTAQADIYSPNTFEVRATDAQGFVHTVTGAVQVQ